jgi:hypothetical protein
LFDDEPEKQPEDDEPLFDDEPEKQPEDDEPLFDDEPEKQPEDDEPLFDDEPEKRVLYKKNKVNNSEKKTYIENVGKLCIKCNLYKGRKKYTKSHYKLLNGICRECLSIHS